MARYIDANALMEKAFVMEYKDEWHMTKSCEFVEVADIENAPTADVVEVVRCKDCKWGSNLFMPDTYACDITNQFNGGNCFCSYGKRRDERRTDDDRNG